jgi:hypothetical protein
MTIESVRQEFEQDLLRLPNVVSVGVAATTDGRPVIQVGVTRKVPASRLRRDEVVPSSLEGYEVEVVEIGEQAAERKEGRGGR